MLASPEAQRAAAGSRGLVLVGAACALIGLVVLTSYAQAPASTGAPALALYVPPAGLRPVTESGLQTMHEAPASVMPPSGSPGARMPAALVAPAASPSVTVPMQYPETQMPMLMMPAPVDSPATQTGSQLFAGFFAGLAASFAIGFTITAKRMYDGMEDGLKGAAGDPELGRLPGRAGVPTMYDISAYDDIWGLDAKTEVYEKWDPEKPRDYDNFNPFERNDEGQQCDKNGFFPGQDNGYVPPNRPDVSWAIQQENDKIMADLKTQPKFNLTGKPGNWKKGWAANLGPAP